MNNNWYSDKKLQDKLDEISGHEETHGNSVRLLPDGKEAFRARFLNLNDADIILIKTFEFWSDKTGLDIVKSIGKRVKNGALAVIQFDVKGTFRTTKEQFNLYSGRLSPIPTVLMELYLEFPDRVILIPTSMPSHKMELIFPGFHLRLPQDHEKYFITWNKSNKLPLKVILGGRNIGDVYALSGKQIGDENFEITEESKTHGYLDLDVELTGPVTVQIVKRYIEAARFHLASENVFMRVNWAAEVKKALSALTEIESALEPANILAYSAGGNSSIRYIPQSSYVIGQSNKGLLPISKVFSELSKSIPSTKKINFFSGYTFPSEEIQEVIINAANRGITWEILVNGPQKRGSSYLYISTKFADILFKKLKAATPDNRLNFFSWEDASSGGMSYIHSKCGRFGDSPEDPFMIGSWNMHLYSIRYASENILLIRDPELKVHFDAFVEKQFKSPWVSNWKSNLDTKSFKGIKNLIVARLLYWFVLIHKYFIEKLL